MNQGVADAAKTGVPGLDSGERQRSGDRSINGVAAGIEHRDAGFGGILGLRNHHATPA